MIETKQKEKISLEMQIRFYEKMLSLYNEIQKYAEQIEKIKKSLDRFTNVEYQIIECQRVINLLDIPIRTRIMFCDTQLKKLYQCIKIRDYSKKQRWSSTFKKD